ncbi:MAG TPA: PLP-dependent aminotransferase family protein [Solirubrobacteraceae bacterium]|nr:PLP-dependent aminotransferase family protein [Solirubrobacteraceae bacterium]
MPVPRADPPRAAARLREVGSSPVREILALTARPGVISFAGGLPAPELFDVTGLREAYARALADDVAGRHLQYSATEGDPGLRELIAARLGARGLPTAPTDVLVTAGSQQALALTATVLVEPGDPVLVEEPSYLAALQCFGLAGARLVPVPCDDTGLIPEAVAQAVADHAPKLLYTVPNFHNPTGRTLPLARRRAIAALAGERGLWLVEDDPYGELRYAGKPIAPLAGLPGAEDRTLALGTLSKIAAPGLRIGWVRAPAALRGELVVAKQAADLHTSTIDQAAARLWLESCDLDARVVALREAYRPRRDALLDGLALALPPGARWTRPEGGMFVWARLPGGRDATALLGRALAHDVAFVPGRPFFAGPADRATLRLSFTAHAPGEIAEGLRRLGRVGAAAQASSS